MRGHFACPLFTVLHIVFNSEDFAWRLAGFFSARSTEHEKIHVNFSAQEREAF